MICINNVFFNDFTRFCHLHHLEESASHPLPLQEGVPQVVRSTLLPVGMGRQIGLGGGPPVGCPGTPLSHDISGSSSSNETNSIATNVNLCVDYDGINPIPVRQREPQKHFRF